MRILFLTNFYPPYELGGQGRSCYQIVEGLKQRGHETLVLTSMHGVDNRPLSMNGVCRHLYLEMDLSPLRHALTFFINRKARLQRNMERLAQTFNEFRPDLVFIGGMWNFSTRLVAYLERMLPGRVVYRFAEYWPTLANQNEIYWKLPGRKAPTKLIKSLLRPLALGILDREDDPPKLRYEHAVCVSAATRDVLVKAGIPIANARIIHTGIDLTSYANKDDLHQRQEENRQGLRILYAGRLTVEKGIETAIIAIGDQINGRNPLNVTLSLAGSGSIEYIDHLQQLVATHNLENHVTFLGWVPHEEMPQLMRRFDVLLVPSEWPEPFARVVLEAMLSEMVVVASDAGGSSEIIQDKQNGLLFASGNSDELGECLRLLARSLHLVEKYRLAGRDTVMQCFGETRMIDAYEAYLLSVAKN